MKRRTFLGHSLAAGTALIAGKLIGVTKFLDPEKYKDMPVTRIIDNKDLQAGISEIGLFNPKGKLISKGTFDPIYMNKGDTLDIK